MKKIGNYFFPDTDIHFQRWVLDGEYQKKQRDDLFLKMNSIKPIKRICDIGGHVGTWSVPMAQYKDTEMIFAFEPNERVRECFIANTLPFKDKVTVYNVALGKENGKALLDIEEDNTKNQPTTIYNCIKKYNITGPIFIKDYKSIIKYCPTVQNGVYYIDYDEELEEEDYLE